MDPIHDGAPARHTPVMADEVLEMLAPQPGQVVVDGTIGCGQHALRLVERLGDRGRLIGLDVDPSMLALAEETLAPWASRVTLIHSRYSGLPGVLAELGIPAVHGVLLDLGGLSSAQLDDPERGFSFQADGALDMRLWPGGTALRAETIVNRASMAELVRVFREYGQERFAGRIARAIVRERGRGRITRTVQLATIVRRAVGPPPRGKRRRIDPSTRVFQALRIAVNQELEELERGLPAIGECICRSGRLVVISFHSLEDGIVKRFVKAGAGRWASLAKKPLRPTPDEVARNSRARSARLRAAEKVEA